MPRNIKGSDPVLKNKQVKKSINFLLVFFLVSFFLNAGFIVFLIYGTLNYNELLQQFETLEQNYKTTQTLTIAQKDEAQQKISNDLEDLESKYNELLFGKRVNLKNNEYMVFSTKIGDKVGDFTLKTINPFGKGEVIDSERAVVIFEGETIITADYEFGDFGGDHYCLVNLTQESQNKVPIAVDMEGKPKRYFVDICFDDPASMKLFKGKKTGRVTAKVSGYSDIFCECDQPNLGGSKIIEIVSLT